MIEINMVPLSRLRCCEILSDGGNTEFQTRFGRFGTIFPQLSISTQCDEWMVSVVTEKKSFHSHHLTCATTSCESLAPSSLYPKTSCHQMNFTINFLRPGDFAWLSDNTLFPLKNTKGLTPVISYSIISLSLLGSLLVCTLIFSQTKKKVSSELEVFLVSHLTLSPAWLKETMVHIIRHFETLI